jgi:uncharacterized protein (TIGR02001 family)
LVRGTAFFGVIASAAAGTACAQAPPPVPNLNAYLTLATGYWKHGLAQDSSAGAAEVGVDYQHHTGWFLGGRAATVHYPNEHYEAARDVELDIYGGYHRRRGQWAYTAMLARYSYPGVGGFDYESLAASAGFRDRYFYTVTYADDFYGLRRRAVDQEVSVAVPFRGDLELGAAIGRFDIDLRGADYTHWNVGVSKLWRRLGLDLRYYDSDYPFATALGDPTATQYVLSVSYALRSRRAR